MLEPHWFFGLSFADQFDLSHSSPPVKENRQEKIRLVCVCVCVCMCVCMSHCFSSRVSDFHSSHTLVDLAKFLLTGREPRMETLYIIIVLTTRVQ